MTNDIRKIHEDVYHFLMDKHNSEGLNFGFRKSNRANRLEQGYWFYGNEFYLGVSFWTGMDWKNRTPNIFFVIGQNGNSYLEISVSDSDWKQRFVAEQLVGPLNLDSGEILKWRKQYGQFDDFYINSLSNFLNNDKEIIDDILRSNASFFEDKPEESIGFISDNDFDESALKINYYRRTSTLEYVSEFDIEEYIDGFQIRDFGPIQDTNFIQFRDDIQWVFFTGENGTGKTSLLKAIAGGICHLKMPEADNAYFKFNFNTKHSIYERRGNQDTSTRRPLLAGFCAYGASRLKNSNSNPKNFSILKSMNKSGLTASLFNSDTVLIDIQDQLNHWSRNDDLRRTVEKRKKYIKEVFVDLLPNIADIRFSEKDNYTTTYYIEKDIQGQEYPPVTFDQLASGLKSLVAMIGDMMMRLFNQQPNIDDPSELSGLVIIDEIDIHLHPNLQKYLVEQLTITFPRVRFLASTHSPIPLLGAPPASQFYKVERNRVNGVEILDLSDISVLNLLPNALLSSELFGMDKLFERKSSNSDLIRTEDTIQESQLNDQVKEDLKRIADQLRNNNNENS